jgi:hypothetical protein
MNPYNKYILLLFTCTRKGAPGPRQSFLARLASSANSTEDEQHKQQIRGRKGEDHLYIWQTEMARGDKYEH